MRLTKKLKPPYEKVAGEDYTYTSETRLTPSFAKVEHKLGQLEDIEEELGIDLVTLLKVWNAVLQKEYLWTKYDNELDQTDDIEIGDDYNGLLYIYFYWYGGKHLTLYLKDYGKTWALTKEELENE